MIRRRLPWILILALLATLPSLYKAYKAKPSYTAAATVLTQSEKMNNLTGNTEPNVNTLLLKTFQDIIRSRPLAQDVITQLNLKMTPDDLIKEVTVTSPSGSLVSTVTVTDEKPGQAIAIANALTQSFVKNAQTYIKIDKVEILSPAYKADAIPVGLSLLRSILVSVFAGLLIGALLAVLWGFMDHTIRDEEELRQLLGLPVLAVISGKAEGLLDPQDAAFEGYRTLRAAVHFAGAGEGGIKTLAVGSPKAGDNTPAFAVNLARAYAQTGQKVLVIDGDLRFPGMHNLLNSQNTAGLANVLSGQANLEKTITHLQEFNLDVMTAGADGPNPAELLSGPRLHELLDPLKQKYDLVIIAATGILAAADAQLLASQTDAVLMVLAKGKIKPEEAVKGKERLDFAGARLLGTVLD